MPSRALSTCAWCVPMRPAPIKPTLKGVSFQSYGAEEPRIACTVPASGR